MKKYLAILAGLLIALAGISRAANLDLSTINCGSNVLFQAGTTNNTYGIWATNSLSTVAPFTNNILGSYAAYTHARIEASCQSTSTTTNGFARFCYSISLDGITWTTQDTNLVRYVDVPLLGTNVAVNSDVITYADVVPYLKFSGIQVNSTTPVTNVSMRIVRYGEFK